MRTEFQDDLIALLVAIVVGLAVFVLITAIV